MRARAGADSFMQDRAISDAGIDAMSERDPLRLFRQRLEKGRMRLLRDEDPIHRNADLPHIGEGAAAYVRGSKDNVVALNAASGGRSGPLDGAVCASKLT
jgi:hypothetical protein